MRTRARRHRQVEAADLNVTAFMNLMVALVPFLLIMAVFSRITILELSLPTGETASSAPTPLLQLEVIVRGDRLVVADQQRGVIRDIPNKKDAYDLAALSQTLQGLKVEAPKVKEATMLLEPQVSYEQVVQVMDTLRVAQVVQNGMPVKAELFPNISVGDAPAAGRGG